MGEVIDIGNGVANVGGGGTGGSACRDEPMERGDHAELAEQLEMALSATAEVVADEGAIWQYRASCGLWSEQPSAKLSRLVQGFAGLPVCCAKGTRELRIDSKDVAGTIKLTRDRLEQTGFFGAAADGIAFTNGFVRVTTTGVVLEPHAPENRARLGFPFAYTAQPEAPRFAAFLREIFEDDPDGMEKEKCIQEAGGAALVGAATRFQKAHVLLGEGANGKSVLVEILRNTMPKGSCVAIPPQDWGCQYRLAMMAGKRLNAVSELPHSDILNGEAFKAVISGDMTTARPIRRDPFSFSPIAGHVFAANRLPDTTDHSHGFWRRLTVIAFNRVFDEEEQDEHLAEKIIAEELAGVVSWLLAGAHRLLRQGQYTLPPSSKHYVTSWRGRADPIRVFVEQRTRPAKDRASGTQATVLYQAYLGWATANGHRPTSVVRFGMRMSALGIKPTSTNTCNRYPLQLSEVSQ